jgi:sodium-dependent dicarboxylate transporter 2/3/5
MLGKWIAGFSGSDPLVLISFMITVVSIFISEVMSNIAQVVVFSPVLGGNCYCASLKSCYVGIADVPRSQLRQHDADGKPPNAIVFASGHIQMKQMMRTGFVMNIVAVILITLFCCCWYRDVEIVDT